MHSTSGSEYGVCSPSSSSLYESEDVSRDIDNGNMLTEKEEDTLNQLEAVVNTITTSMCRKLTIQFSSNDTTNRTKKNDELNGLHHKTRHDQILSKNDPALAYASLLRVMYATMRCGSILTRKLACENVLNSILLKKLIKNIFGSTSNNNNGIGGDSKSSSLYDIHILDGHLATKCMSVLILTLKEGGNNGVAPTLSRYKETKECCLIVIRFTSIMLHTCRHFLSGGPGDVLPTLGKFYSYLLLLVLFLFVFVHFNFTFLILISIRK
jgi:hypothetical protein